jgi:hypothetical protein
MNVEMILSTELLKMFKHHSLPTSLCLSLQKITTAEHPYVTVNVIITVKH